MDRRHFLKVSHGIAGALLCDGCSSLLSASGSNIVRFGLVTDLHFAHRAKSGSRYYEQSVAKLRDAIRVFNEQKPDFIIELGDFKDQGSTATDTLAFLDEIEAEYQTFNGPAYHVLGNHDQDNISKEDFFKHISNPGAANGKRYYSFAVNGVKFIVLDANYKEDGTDYDRGNFDWTKAFIPSSQTEWLSRELNTRKPVVIFLHQLLDVTRRKDGTVVGNADAVNEILARRGNVMAVFQGHHHAGSYNFSNGIHYFTMNGMIEGALPKNNSYAVVSIDKSHSITVDGYFNCEDRLLERRL
ncbi:MAG: metallophosphoesterase [Bacteroidales bacterium]|jgi:alkaline phosphatase|nr:metallophosphoesterase [Bacteroidales bacterium]